MREGGVRWVGPVTVDGSVTFDWPLIGREAELAQIVAALGSTPGVVIAGPAGAGKTRLAREVMSRVDTDRFHCERVAGTVAGASIPFGALAALLPIRNSEAIEPLQMIRYAYEGVAEVAGERDLLLMVDDAHLLDDGSATLIHQLALTRSATVLLTIRTPELVPDPITAMWKDGLVQRFEITTLDSADFDALLEATLSGPIDRISRGVLWRLSRGNPMFLRELIYGAVESGSLTRVDKRWTIRGQLTASPRLAEVVETRLRRLTVGERNLLEALALGEPLGLDDLEPFGTTDMIDSLEAAGLLATDASRRRTLVRIEQRIYAEVIAATIPIARQRRIYRTLSDGIAASGRRRRGDLLRYAKWRLEAGSPIDVEIGLKAARHAVASMDYLLAEGVARELLAAEASRFEALVVLGTALFHQGRAEEADDVLSEAFELATNDEERALAAVPKAFNLCLALRQWPEALQFVIELREELESPVYRNEATAALAALYRVTGNSHHALELAQGLLSCVESNPPTRARALMVAHACEIAFGHFSNASKYSAEAADYVGEYPELRLDELVLHSFTALGVGLAGDLPRGVAMAREGFENALKRLSYPEIAYWGFCLGELLILRGLMAEACSVLEETVTVLRIADPLGMTSPVLSEAAQAAVLTGEKDVADLVIAEAQALRGDTAAGRGVAARMALQGDARGAAETAAATGRRAIARTNVVWGAFALHDATRFGFPEFVAEELAEVVADFDGELMSLLSQHTSALVHRDAAELIAVAERFDALGASLYAAEVMAQAALHSQGGAVRRRLELNAWRLLAECLGCRPTPCFTDLAGSVLTRRELEVARQASAGLSSREIADRLFISVRTVDNHLSAVYTKLGVRGRSDLAAILGPA